MPRESKNLKLKLYNAITDSNILARDWFNSIFDYSDSNYTKIDDAYKNLLDLINLKADKDYVTPEMFGASGNGVIDDTKSVQNSIDFAISNNIPLFLKNRYLISSTLNVRGSGTNVIKDFYMHGITVENYGEYTSNSTLIADNGFNGDTLVLLEKTTNACIDKISLTSNKKQGVNGITLKNSSGLVVNECNVSRFKTGIELNYSGVNKLTNCNVAYCHTGILATCSGDTSIINCYVNTNGLDQDKSLEDQYYSAIAFQAGSSNCNVIGGKVEWNYGGISIIDSLGINIIGVNFDNNASFSVNVLGVKKDKDFTKCNSINISSNVFERGGFTDKQCFINLKSTALEVQATITGNSFKKYDSNMNSDEDGPVKAINITSTDNIANVLLTGNNAFDCSTENFIEAGGKKVTVYSCNNLTNKGNYIYANAIYRSDEYSIIGVKAVAISFENGVGYLNYGVLGFGSIKNTFLFLQSTDTELVVSTINDDKNNRYKVLAHKYDGTTVGTGYFYALVIGIKNNFN